MWPRHERPAAPRPARAPALHARGPFGTARRRSRPRRVGGAVWRSLGVACSAVISNAVSAGSGRAQVPVALLAQAAHAHVPPATFRACADSVAGRCPRVADYLPADSRIHDTATTRAPRESYETRADVVGGPPLAFPLTAGARRTARRGAVDLTSAAATGRTTFEMPATRSAGGSLGQCSVPRAAILGAVLGAGVAYIFAPFLGHDARQHVAWGVLITVGVSAMTVFIDQAPCPRGDA